MELQGNRVLVPGNSKKEALLLTIVHVVDVGDRRELHLVNKEEKSKESCLLTQELADRLVPLKDDPRAQWQLL
jgi:hypothetical protein